MVHIHCTVHVLSQNFDISHLTLYYDIVHVHVHCKISNSNKFNTATAKADKYDKRTGSRIFQNY